MFLGDPAKIVAGVNDFFPGAIGDAGQAVGGVIAVLDETLVGGGDDPEQVDRNMTGKLFHFTLCP